MELTLTHCGEAGAEETAADDEDEALTSSALATAVEQSSGVEADLFLEASLVRRVLCSSSPSFSSEDNLPLSWSSLECPESLLVSLSLSESSLGKEEGASWSSSPSESSCRPFLLIVDL